MSSSEEPNARTVKYWRWRYRDPQTGCIRRTTFRLTAAQASGLTGAEPIPASMSLRDVDDFADTLPLPFERSS
jgi:hypothetical protein